MQFAQNFKNLLTKFDEYAKITVIIVALMFNHFQYCYFLTVASEFHYRSEHTGATITFSPKAAASKIFKKHIFRRKIYES